MGSFILLKIICRTHMGRGELNSDHVVMENFQNLNVPDNKFVITVNCENARHTTLICHFYLSVTCLIICAFCMVFLFKIYILGKLKISGFP